MSRDFEENIVPVSCSRACRKHTLVPTAGKADKEELLLHHVLTTAHFLAPEFPRATCTMALHGCAAGG